MYTVNVPIEIAETGKEKASESAEGAKNVAGEVVDTVKEKAIAAKEVIVETASKVVEGTNYLYSSSTSSTSLSSPTTFPSHRVPTFNHVLLLCFLSTKFKSFPPISTVNLWSPSCGIPGTPVLKLKLSSRSAIRSPHCF